MIEAINKHGSRDIPRRMGKVVMTLTDGNVALVGIPEYVMSDRCIR